MSILIRANGKFNEATLNRLGIEMRKKFLPVVTRPAYSGAFESLAVLLLAVMLVFLDPLKSDRTETLAIMLTIGLVLPMIIDFNSCALVSEVLTLVSRLAAFCVIDYYLYLFVCFFSKFQFKGSSFSGSTQP